MISYFMAVRTERSPMFTASDLVERVRGASARPSDLGDGPGDAISLAMGETSDSTPLLVVNAAVEALMSGRTRYERFTGSPGLRTRIAEALNAEGAGAITPDNVVITHGASAGLGAAILTLINPGDVVVLPEPTYSRRAWRGRESWSGPAASTGRRARDTSASPSPREQRNSRRA
jgi:aspartate aminotransferase